MLLLSSKEELAAFKRAFGAEQESGRNEIGGELEDFNICHKI